MTSDPARAATLAHLLAELGRPVPREYLSERTLSDKAPYNGRKIPYLSWSRGVAYLDEVCGRAGATWNYAVCHAAQVGGETVVSVRITVVAAGGEASSRESSGTADSVAPFENAPSPVKTAERNAFVRALGMFGVVAPRSLPPQAGQRQQAAPRESGARRGPARQPAWKG